MVGAAVIGIACSAAWWLWTSDTIAREYGVPLVVGTQLAYTLRVGWLITAVDAAMIVLPAVVLWLLRVRVRQSLDGFILGALGALVFSATGTITWFAPQFFAGLMDNYRPWRLFEEAYLYGFVDPLTAAAAGGMTGLLLWFRPRGDLGGNKRRIRMVLALLAAVGLFFYLAVYVVDAAAPPREQEMIGNSVLTIIALVLARFAIQVALLNEDPGPTGEQPTVCGLCRQEVPDTPFCPECGGARRACPPASTLGTAR